jgi:GTP pyrophosphokinase
VLHEDEKDRLVPVEWGKTDALYPVRIRVEAWDRVGLMRDVSTIVAEEKLNMGSLSSTNHQDYTISLDFTLETEGLAQLSRLLKKIEAVRGVVNITRVGDESSVSSDGKT